MKSTKKLLIIVLFLSTINYPCPPTYQWWEPSTVHASSHQRAGENGANVLEIKPGVRPAAMGGAFVAIADDANAVNYNPAGLAYLNKDEFQFIQNKYFDEIISNHINWVYPLSEMHAKDVYDLGVLAGGFTFMDYGSLAGRNEFGVDTGEFGARDRVISLSYGKAFNPNFSIGITGREIREEIFALKAKGYSFDAGILFSNVIDTVNIGLVAQNLGENIGFEKESHPLPTNYVVGSAFNLFDDRLILAADLNKPVHNFYYWNLGGEYWLSRILTLRLGYSTKHDIGNGLSCGLGITLHEFEFSFLPFSELAISYAYMPYGDLGVDNRLELLIKIGVE